MSRATSGVNCLIGVDKPLGMTSHDVVARVRRALGERRVGHAGTLDPAASGVLVLGVGQATRLLGVLTLDEKCYEARIAFGSETSTDDAEGEVIRRAEVASELSDPAFAQAAIAALVGAFEQVPPAYSAVSVDGKRAYARARAGEQLELAARPVEVYEAKLLGIELPVHADDELVWNVRLRVSKGTYVRSIARDLGRSLGTAAHLVGLARTSAGMVDVAHCLNLDEVADLGRAGIEGAALDPVRCLGLAVRLLDASELHFVATGKPFLSGLVLDLDGEAVGLREPRRAERVSLVLGTRFYGIWQERGGQLRAQTNFPSGIAGVRP